jgi:riboflavin kinase / FMN adenylyltransferase
MVLFRDLIDEFGGWVLRFIRGLNFLPDSLRGCVLTIGSFDGVHLGHQSVLSEVCEKARELGLPSVVISFEPQPRDFFQPEKVPPRLSRLREKIRLLEKTGVDAFLLLKFNAQLSSMSAEQFMQDLLCDSLAVKHIIIGDDFCFGKGRTGNFESLKAFGQINGFGVSRQNSFLIDGTRVSSTEIRRLLMQGEMAQAEKLLGQHYRMAGRVLLGQQKGRTIGFPTINIKLFRDKSPIQGVFVVEVVRDDQTVLNGVASIGNRPVVKDDDSWVLEVHIFDFNENMYGEYVCVNFLHKIRDEMHFDDFDTLKVAIEKDVTQARNYFDK